MAVVVANTRRLPEITRAKAKTEGPEVEALYTRGARWLARASTHELGL